MKTRKTSSGSVKKAGIRRLIGGPKKARRRRTKSAKARARRT